MTLQATEQLALAPFVILGLWELFPYISDSWHSEDLVRED